MALAHASYDNCSVCHTPYSYGNCIVLANTIQLAELHYCAVVYLNKHNNAVSIHGWFVFAKAMQFSELHCCCRLDPGIISDCLFVVKPIQLA
jgi:hypothetical protein